MLDFFFLLAVGKGFIYLIQSLPPVKTMSIKYFHELFNCDLCLGVWIYFIFCCFFRIELTQELVGISVPLVSQAVTAAIASLMMHYMSLGFKLKHGMFEVE